MELEVLATRAVEMVGTHLATAVARVPGEPMERLYLLLATNMRKSPAGSAIFAELENLPNDQGTRRVAAVRLLGLAERDPRFAADLGRAVRAVLESPPRASQTVTSNRITGNVTGMSVQAGTVSNSTIARDVDNSRRTRISTGGFVLIIFLVLGVGAAGAVFVTNLFDNDATGGAASQSSGFGFNGDAPDGGDASGGGDCGRAERPELTLSPEQGPVDTKITVSGVGFIPNGVVDIVFHAAEMGEATTDCHGVFATTLPIPEKEFYGQFPNQSFDVHTSEWTSSGQYQGNGDFNGAQFYITG